MAAQTPPETAFSFPDLSAPARRLVRVFQVHQFLDRFAMGLTVAIVALALSDRGFTLSEITLLFGVYAVTTMALELPFGGVADLYGRKPVFLSAVLVSLLSLALFLVAQSFWVMALSFACIGLGRALRSGSLDAWFVERFRSAAPGVELQPALARAQAANALGLASGAVLGGLLPDLLGARAEALGLSPYDTSYLASFAIMVGVFLFTLFAIDEPRRPRPTDPKQSGIWAGVQAVPQVITTAGRLAVSHPVLILLFSALALFLMATNPVEVLWPTEAKPLLPAGAANALIGALTAAYFLAIAGGAALSPWLHRRLGRQAARTFCVALAWLAVLQLALALQGEIWGFAGILLAFAVGLGVIDSPASALLHGCVADSQRATLLSLRSLLQQLGAALGLVLAGVLADAVSTSLAWGVGAAILVLALGLSVRLIRLTRA